MKSEKSNVQLTAKEQAFIKTIWTYYHTHGRHTLPWRIDVRPYQILVSEVMLQQTQVTRVLPKYEAFLERFPTVEALADAPLGEVLRSWQGLGYNRRAKALHACAAHVVHDRNGTFPRTYDELLVLPGVGPYTAGAILAFSYNEAVPILETNIRTVYLHHFFKNTATVSDAKLLKKLKRTMPHEQIREWYWALMDYGSYLKREHGNANVRSAQYTKQSRFTGSDRQIRGAILRELARGKRSKRALCAALKEFAQERVETQLTKLVNEQLIERHARSYRLPT